MDKKNNDEYLWEIYNINKEWIKFADAKAIAFIAIIGIIFKFIIDYYDKISVLYNSNIIKIVYFASIILLFISIIFSVICIFPRKSNSNKNIIYYKSITENFHSESDYIEYFNSLNDENRANQIKSQIYQLATVSNGKYYNVEWILKFFLGGFILTLIWSLLLMLGVSFDVLQLLEK